jgi:hypothetical protein
LRREGVEVTTKEHLSLHDKQIASIRALIKGGMQLVVATREDMRAFRKDMRALQQAQARTEKNLNHLIAGLGRGRNGKH